MKLTPQQKLLLEDSPELIAEFIPDVKDGDKGEPGHTPTDEELTDLIKPLIPEVKDGEDYILTEEDKIEIASKIEVPIVEKVIEKTKVIQEIPIVTNEIKEVAVTDEPNIIAEKLNTLEGAIEAKVIKDGVTRKEVEQISSGMKVIDGRIKLIDQRWGAHGGGGKSMKLETNGTPNGSQALLNLVQGTNITITDDGLGDVTIASTGGGTPAGSTGDVQFNTSGAFDADTGNFFWDKTNHRLGIGTTSPLAPLDIHGTMTNFTTGGSDSVRFGINAGGAGTPTIVLDNAVDTFSLDNLDGTGLRFVHNNATVPMVLTSAGNVGIGTTTPSTKLEVNGDITGDNFTNNTILSSNGSKVITSLALATYPSLTELSYVKGVTSAIQTQLNSKGSGTVTSITAGTGLTGGTITTTGTIALDLTASDTWTGAHIWNPSSNSTIAQTIKQKSGSSVNLWQILSSSNVAEFYVDSTRTFNVSNDMKFHNIAASSILALTSSNNITGINSLINLSYNAGASTFTAIPSGSSTDYQFNASGSFDGNSWFILKLYHIRRCWRLHVGLFYKRTSKRVPTLFLYTRPCNFNALLYPHSRNYQ